MYRAFPGFCCNTLIDTRPGKPISTTTCYFVHLVIAAVLLAVLFSPLSSIGQDASLGAIRGSVSDAAGARVRNAAILIVNVNTGIEHRINTDADGRFASSLLPPGDYSIRAQASGMAPQVFTNVHVEIAGALELEFKLALAGAHETVEINSAAPMVETQSSEVSHVIDERSIADLPINGRRFTDLALLTPGVTQDPRGLTSSSNGDLAFGGVRGFQSSMLVDGADNNNSFFAQGRGRYRAPYQFSNEVVQEFRVSSNAYSAELGRSGGGVVNVVTKSGTNQLRGSAFYYVRDNRMNAQHPFTDVKPSDRQHQFGFTLGGRLKKNRVFYFGGWDQHIFRVPTVVRFLDGSTVLRPTSGDYESTDRALVQGAAAKLSQLGGNFRSELLGNAGFFKVDVSLTPRQFLTFRINTSRYGGQNNVFFDPSSPVTNYGISENGEEQVRTETGIVSLTSALGANATSHLRVQFSRDLQQSRANSEDVRTSIGDVIEAFGRSSILPRRTREHKFHLSDTLSFETHRHSWKLGGDVSKAWVYNFFPSLFGGQYLFRDIRVDPWTFEPATYGMWITPLRAYAHNVPRYYIQNFGTADSHPDSSDYAFFAQDAIRVTSRLALNVGVRYDLQTFSGDGLQNNPLWEMSGKLPHDSNNIAPRVGFAYSIGERRPLVVRAGYGVFYTRIPSMYTSAVKTDNGLAQSHLFLENSRNADAVIFPQYPNPIVICGITEPRCEVPDSLASHVTSEISAFSPNFRVPFVQQASLTVEREIAERFAVSASYLYVHGEHLIRARDANLPEPEIVSYPVFSEDGNSFTGAYYDIPTFSTWQMTRSMSCPFAPCINDLQRPLSQVGSVNVFESAATSVYHGLTISARRRMTRGFYFRIGYTYAKAIDDGQDAMVVGRPVTVENSYSTQSERGRSTTDQRHRFMASWIAEPRPFHRDRPVLRFFFNDWKFSSIVTVGSGRPVNASVIGDPNRDGNSANDRLPGVSRNALTGPDYFTTDLRVTRRLHATERVRLEFLAESFNVMNRANKRVDLSDDGFLASAGDFVMQDKVVAGKRYPAHYRANGGFLTPNNAYSPRQIQLSLRLSF
ncbi:MAG TPA: TonB-dependent receptor [Clostridia bacterium]|nr:TonB-dependent receptor [Clostridia bacterium]